MLGSKLLMAAAGAGGGGVVISLTANVVVTANSTNYSGLFDGIAIGTAADDRVIAVVMSAARATAGARTVSSCTVGGVSAALVARQTSTNGDAHEIWSAVVPTGTTADIDIVFSSSMGSCGIGVYNIEGADGAPASATAVDTGTALSQSLTVPVNGGAIAGGSNVSGGGATATWDSPMVEAYDENVEDRTQSGAIASSTGSITVAVNFTVDRSDDTMVAAAWSA